MAEGLIERSIRVAKLEKLRRLKNMEYQKNPMLWLKERFQEEPTDYQWSLFSEYIEHKWDGDVDPLWGAWQAIADQKSAAVESATGTGKTRWLARVVFWFLDVFDNSLVVTSAPKQAQLTLNLWSEIQSAFHKFKKIRPRAAMYNLRLVVEDKDEADTFDLDAPDKSKSWQAIGFVAGVGSEEQSATKAQGFHRKDMLIITEETPGMPRAVINAFRNTCTAANNIMLSVGNPDNELDPLHILCGLPDVSAFRVSGYDHPNVVLKKEIFPGAVSIPSITKRKDEYGIKSSLYQSRVRGISPAQSMDSLIQMAWIDEAINRKSKYDGGYHALGVDVANSSDGDKAALAWGKGNSLKEIQDFYCNNANHLAYNTFMSDEELSLNGYNDYSTSTIKDYDIMDGFIGVDPVGVGAATVNTYLDNGFNPHSLTGRQWDEAIPEERYVDEEGKEHIKPMWKFQNLRSQMYWELREDLRRGLVDFDLPDDKDLIREVKSELVAIRVMYRSNMIVVEGKDEIKKRIGGKSPNKADAIVYWNWVRKGYRVFGNARPIG